MREILFRGKRVDNGEWVEGYLLQSDLIVPIGQMFNFTRNGDKNIITSDSQIEFYKVILETVGQHTGLTDKNGNKIFEGDIVDFIKRGEDESYGVVQYSNEETEFYLSYDNLTLGLGRCNYSEELEVICNIYDNPELLGVRE